VDLTAVAFELLGIDLEELHTAGLLGGTQHVVDPVYHRVAIAAADKYTYSVPHKASPANSF
jgi:hypothetical protein